MMALSISKILFYPFLALACLLMSSVSSLMDWNKYSQRDLIHDQKLLYSLFFRSTTWEMVYVGNSDRGDQEGNIQDDATLLHGEPCWKTRMYDVRIDEIEQRLHEMGRKERVYE